MKFSDKNICVVILLASTVLMVVFGFILEMKWLAFPFIVSIFAIGFILNFGAADKERKGKDNV